MTSRGRSSVSQAVLSSQFTSKVNSHQNSIRNQAESHAVKWTILLKSTAVRVRSREWTVKLSWQQSYVANDQIKCSKLG